MEEQSSFAQIDEAIRKQQDAVDKVKAKYDDEQKRLKELQRKKEQKALKAISTAMKKSTKTYEEVLAFIQG
ncbi:MAG: ErpK protein [Lachnospiraceae bacterium]|jgi:predicted  nucleic acid-binding Zn-ribbon protein|nr:ErpK protein [Lachnospiraceae bacterium]MCH4033571.1 ErpK protein [Lachnospiraceae bacterium]MCH4033825.1 ErpK protein [Lachnospiraceae bacterium]MCH4034954.1 ErpK protein [Lachnospiraceae bacterium]MCH4034966.1 ErpK protein [Lachnospiraceae bacterium]